MGRKKKIEDDSCYQKCCVCIHKTSRNCTQVTQLHRKKRKRDNFEEDESLTIFDILEDLKLLNYEVNEFIR
jgi:hypothetical protein